MLTKFSLFLLFIRFYFFHFTTAVQSRWFGEHWWTHGESSVAPINFGAKQWAIACFKLAVGGFTFGLNTPSTSKGSSNHPGGVPLVPTIRMSGSPFWR